LAEVEESDVYVGVIGYRLGSIDSESRKPFTVLEYEKAVEQGAEILIYIADDDAASFPQSVIDQDGRSRKRLQAFKDKLREHHTVDTFTTADDLSEKLTRDFRKHFAPTQPEEVKGGEDAYGRTLVTLKSFVLTPKRYNGHEILLQMSFYWSVFPASRELCRRFNLEYGNTVGSYCRILQPADKEVTSGFREIYATGNRVDSFVSLVQTKTADLHAQLQFAEDDVRHVKAEFLGHSEYDHGDNGGDPNEIWVPAEGKVILLFTKGATN
jgi:hypothetical protein